jgi:hypothetical protein
MSVEKSSHFLKNYALSGIIVAAAALIGLFIAAPYYSLNNLFVQAQAPPHQQLVKWQISRWEG